ncbi:MAG: universal stress protein [Thermodesulfobacteriota bacterium]
MFNKLVLVSFGPDVSDGALNYAIYLAKVLGSKIYSLYIKPTTYNHEKEQCLSDDEKRKNIEWSEYTYKQNLNKIEEFQNKINKEGIDSSYTILEGVPCLEILSFAKVKSADLIVIDKGKNFQNKCIVQKTTLYVVKHSSIPVLVTNQSDKTTKIKNILVPTDKYNIGTKSFKLACNISEKLNSRIVQLNILKKHDPKIPAEVFERMHGDSYFNLSKSEVKNKKIESVVIDSESISDGITDYSNSNDIDIIILETYWGEKQDVFDSNGSVAEKIIQQVYCPVLTLKTEEEVTIYEK